MSCLDFILKLLYQQLCLGFSLLCFLHLFPMSVILHDLYRCPNRSHVNFGQVILTVPYNLDIRSKLAKRAAQPRVEVGIVAFEKLNLEVFKL